MNAQQKSEIKHQLYRCEGGECIIDTECEVEWDAERKQQVRVISWNARSVSRDGNGQIKIGPSFVIPANEIFPIGRVITTLE